MEQIKKQEFKALTTSSDLAMMSLKPQLNPLTRDTKSR